MQISKDIKRMRMRLVKLWGNTRKLQLTASNYSVINATEGKFHKTPQT